MRSLFIAFTPYQCINSSTLALSNVNSESDIIVMEWGNKCDKKLITNLYKIFKNVYVIPNLNYFKQNNEGRMINYYKYNKKIWTLLKDLKQRRYTHIYASSENNLYVQFFLKKLIKDTAKYYHFEDGSFEYSSYVEINKGMTNKIKVFLHGMLLGYHKKEYNFPGQAGIVKKLYLLYPEFRRAELLNKKAENINKKIFNNAINILYPDVALLNNGIVICLDLSDRGEFCINLNQKVYDIVKNQTDNLYLKYHPREFQNNYYIKSDVKINLIDSSLPIECILKNFKGIIVSNLSSSLHIITFMNPNIKVICTACLGEKIEEKAYVEMLTKLNVKMPKTEAELCTLLQNEIQGIGVKK